MHRINTLHLHPAPALSCTQHNKFPASLHPARHSVFVVGPPPAEPGFELPLVFAMQKPAAHKPSDDAIAAAAALKPPQPQRDEGGGAAAPRAPAAPPLPAAARGTKRKHEEEDDESESSATDEDGSAAEAEPLC